MKLSIVLAARNELTMLSVTVLSAIEAIKEARVEGEVFVVDNSDPEIWAAVQLMLAGQLKDGLVRLVHEESPSIAAALDRAHREAKGELLFYTDAHTLIGTGTIPALLDFFERHENEPLGFVHAPIQWAHCSTGTRRTYFGLNNTQLGDWGDCRTIKYERKVTWKGMPYMIRKEVYLAMNGLGCCADSRLGWGVMRYIGIKPWLLGYENWAIPAGVVYHFGEWPKEIRHLMKYRTYSKSGDGKFGLSLAVTPYVFGGEELLRQEYARLKLGQYFKTVEICLEEVRKVAEADYQWMLSNRKYSLQELVKLAPWGDDLTKPVETITPEYAQLNAGLHRDASVMYGYKGADQADEVLACYRKYRCAYALDYGAGKQGLSKALKGKAAFRDYDPAIPEISGKPAPAHLVVCTDVLEHVEPHLLENVLAHLHQLTQRVIYLRVCVVPCTSKTLPDGSDPHRIVQSWDWWIDKLSVRFSLKEVLENDARYFTIIMLPR